MSAQSSRPTGNLFLDHLTQTSFAALAPLLHALKLERGYLVHDQNEPIQRVLFPIGSIVSIVLDMADGATAEVGLIGREGMSGVPIALGQISSNQRAFVQVPDGGLSMSGDDFRSALDRDPALKAFSLRYAQAVIMSTAQLSACNNLHTVNERCARWLLMAHDRVEADVVLLTQDFLSQMLGVRRPGVTLAASALQEAGFISYARGTITVRDRRGLEAAACECYAAVERDWKALMGYSIRKLPGQDTHDAQTRKHHHGRVKT